MCEHIHARFVEIGHGLSPALGGALSRLGPVAFTPDDSQPLCERLARSVAGQQLSVKAARTIWSRVEAAAGDVPLMDFLRERNAATLRACGLSGAKTAAVCAIAAEARAGGLDSGELRYLCAADRARHLTRIRGVGPWTADMVNMFYFGEEDIWPDGDIAARNTLASLTSKRRKTIRTAERFAPHRTRLALYMWRWVDARPD
ncbi:DNA-3-methyladenine glycosylase 2 family protein [Marinicauda algicola]|uniref:DNA-3-methyladenine glycosylase II n=1 Tax=Marinicauda algicola TaxID=2029849 RepID=A0A4S2H2V1_9PROT|nr:DNA-3-methyladenine glycosylase [Marinicauda algicola]TGY89940.1 DNA-3-methyladenine glycosylase 2 family protein [Marinicauda algicola]